MKLLQAIGNFFAFWNKANIKFSTLKRDEEKRDTSTHFGGWAIAYSIIGFVIVALCLWGVSAIFGYFSDGASVGNGQYDFPFLSLVVIIFCIIVAVVVFIKCLIYALMLVIYQFRLNKRGIRFVALFFWFAAVIGCIVIAVLVFT